MNVLLSCYLTRPLHKALSTQKHERAACTSYAAKVIAQTQTLNPKPYTILYQIPEPDRSPKNPVLNPALNPKPKTLRTLKKALNPTPARLSQISRRFRVLGFGFRV